MRRFAVVVLASFAFASPFACGGSGGATSAASVTSAGGASSSASSAAGGAGTGGFTITTSGGGSIPCNDAGLTGDNGCGGALPPATFQNDVAPILAACSGELCHAPPTYASLVGKLSTECCDGRELVKPGDARRSYVVDKIEGADLCGGAPMPLGMAMLPDAKIQAIRSWICAGAKND